jgi:hypothetical protein
MGQVIQSVLGVIQLVCFILVIVKMFQNGKTGLAIVCIVTSCFCIGGLITFIYGWMKSKEWNLMPIMLTWTGAFVLGIIMNFIFPTDYSAIQQQLPHQ